MAIPLINGVQHSWADIKVNINGTLLIDITNISYTSKQEKSNLYGQGNQPTGRSRGKKEYEASMTIRLGEVQALRDTVPSRELVDIEPFDIVVVYVPRGGIVITETIKNVEFLESSIDVSEGDEDVQVTLPLLPSHIV
jgi:hypothetical protein